MAECYVDNGVTYRGTMDRTEKGSSCIHWADSNKHTPTKFPDKVCLSYSDMTMHRSINDHNPLCVNFNNNNNNSNNNHNTTTTTTTTTATTTITTTALYNNKWSRLTVRKILCLFSMSLCHFQH